MLYGDGHTCVPAPQVVQAQVAGVVDGLGSGSAGWAGAGSGSPSALLPSPPSA